jgi:hypothetical protein
MKRLVLAAATVALVAVPKIPAAQAEIIEVCRVKATGALYWPLGSQRGKCRAGDKLFKLERPIGGAKDVEVPRDPS